MTQLSPETEKGESWINRSRVKKSKKSQGRECVCVCVVSKCSTCHSSFRGFICGSKGTWLSWLCCGDGRYLCVHALQMCQQVSTSGKRYDIVSLREVHKTFTAISSSFYVLFSSITTQQMQHTNMVGAVGQKGIDGIEQGRRYSMFASASYLPPVNAPHDDSPRALKLQSYSWEVKIFWMSAFTISRLFFFLCCSFPLKYTYRHTGLCFSLNTLTYKSICLQLAR